VRPLRIAGDRSRNADEVPVSRSVQRFELGEAAIGNETHLPV